jgi:hypothetical protein
MILKVFKITKDYVQISQEPEVIKYIKENFDLSQPTVIMAHYINQQNLIKALLPNVEVVSSTSKAEGVDYSHVKNFIILSSDYSGAKFIQRRERIININGSNTLLVHHILVKKAISEQVYKRVSKKQDFNNATYERSKLS